GTDLLWPSDISEPTIPSSTGVTDVVPLCQGPTFSQRPEAPEFVPQAQPAEDLQEPEDWWSIVDEGEDVEEAELGETESVEQEARVDESVVSEPTSEVTPEPLLEPREQRERRVIQPPK
ncbi:unnamed protein product, partial [Staurois parvus]